jgi:type IV secretion system protein VirB10
MDAGRELADIRPFVGDRPNNRGMWTFGIFLASAASLLFYLLESRREAMVATTTMPRPDSYSGVIASPPPLAIPREFQSGENSYAYPQVNVTPAPPPTAAPRPPVTIYRPAPSPTFTSPPIWRQDVPPPPPLPLSSTPVGPAVVYDGTASPGRGAPDSKADSKGEERVQATHFQNPSSTIPKGTIIQAVLETALNSSRPGFARALVSRDVFSFDGAQILIPKGSRLIGEYKSDLTLGQSRALIQWQRLMRPDGVMIDLDSPAADPLGRAGVKGKVNSHFFERFGGAILQSSLDIGVQLATSKVANGAVIYALPGSLRGTVPTQENVQPTVTVRQGTSVSVFVARDLDFSTVSQ